MRVKVGPGEWRDMGPSRAITSTAHAATVSGRPVGHMDAVVTQELTTVRGGKRADGVRLGIRKR